MDKKENMKPTKLKKDDVVQINPIEEPIFGRHFMVVLESNDEEVTGYCYAFHQKDEGENIIITTGITYRRCSVKSVEFIGKAIWVKE